VDGVSTSEFIYGPNFVKKMAATKINTNHKKAISYTLDNNY